MSSQQQPKQWNIPDEMAPFISEKCPNGTYLVCSICLVFNINKRKFGLVKMRNPFWLGYYNDHLKSMRHKDNCLKKVNHEEANKRRQLKDEWPQKQMRQSILSFAREGNYHRSPKIQYPPWKVVLQSKEDWWRQWNPRGESDQKRINYPSKERRDILPCDCGMEGQWIAQVLPNQDGRRTVLAGQFKQRETFLS